ncbi:hypothetical protein EG68_02981 [Paragonimus skrjabini miyazakii]|uniref:Dendritic cell-specific transmembrane protein-like domain-containing protein n=1 Tax=Paragonimus skrjabini miyazakii TaxID=59628 RepID=A0A8S9YXZ0_9TREM|nr:hypothetical protein EG68_02981 [Paragonimus skrjabini miyazakii]
MRACHLGVLCIGISLIVIVHTICGTNELKYFLREEVSRTDHRSVSMVDKRIGSRLSIKIILDIVGPLMCILFWSVVVAVRLHSRDLNEKQYKMYYIVSTILWQFLTAPYILISMLHSVYLLFILLDDAGFVHGEAANSLHDAFTGLSMDMSDMNKMKLLNSLVRVQRRFACCGGTSYMNWLKLDMHPPVVDPDVNHTEFDPWSQRYMSGFFPTSCCDRDQTITCASSLLIPSEELTIYYMSYEAPVYRRDCITTIYQHLYKELGALIGLFAAVDICLHLLQVCTQLYAYHKSAARYPCHVWANRLPPLQSSLTPPKMGSRKESTGSITHRTGSITHMDGSRTHRDGSVTFPNGKTLPAPEKLIHRSGSVTLRSGSRLHRTGSRTHLDGSRTHRTGSITYQDGARKHRDQTITPGPGDSREACMVGDKPQMFFGSTGYISTERLIQACQGMQLMAQPSLSQQLDLEDKAEWLENTMKIGWIAHGGGKQYCIFVPRISLKPNRAAGPTQTSEFRRFLRLHLPIVEAIIYADGNAVLEPEANAYYRSFGVSFIRAVLFLIFGYIAASLIFPIFLPTNLDSPVFNTASNWHSDSEARGREDLKTAEDSAAIHRQVTWQAGMLLYACIMYGALASKRVRCLLLLSMPVFGMSCGHMYLANQMLQATLLGPVANSERNFIATGSTLECLAEMTYNVSRDVVHVTQMHPLADEITENAADVIGEHDSEFRKVTPGLIELSQQLAKNIMEKIMLLHNASTPILTLPENQTKMAGKLEQRYTSSVQQNYLKSARKLINSLSELVSKQYNQLHEESTKAGLSRIVLEQVQSAITTGSEFETSVTRTTILQCMLVKSQSVSLCETIATNVCKSLENVIKTLSYEPVWFREACPPGGPSVMACPSARFLNEAEKQCHNVPSTLAMEYGVGAFGMQAINLLQSMANEFVLQISNITDEYPEPPEAHQWMIRSSSEIDVKPNQLSDVMYTLFYTILIISALARLFIIGVFYQTHCYISHYLTDVHFDNIYAGSMFERIDSNRLNEGRETLLPLKSMETEHVHWRRKFYSMSEMKHLFINLLKTVMFGFLLLLLFAVNKHLYEMVLFLIDVTVGYYGMRMRVRQTQYTGTQASVIGDGMFHQILTQFFHNIAKLKDIDLNYDAAFCSPFAYQTSELLQSDYYQSWCLLIALVLVSPLLLRARHVITSFFYPSRTRNRTVALYNALLTQRRRHMTTCRNQIVHWVREGRLQEEARHLSQPTFLASISPKLAKYLGMDKKMCLICHDMINSGPSVNVCTLDRAALCRQCVEVVLKRDVCVVCLDRNPKRLFKERRKIQRLENQMNLRMEDIH